MSSALLNFCKASCARLILKSSLAASSSMMLKAYAAVVGYVERVCIKVSGLNGGPESDREWLLADNN